MQSMPKSPLAYLPRVKLNFEDTDRLARAEIIRERKDDLIERAKSA